MKARLFLAIATTVSLLSAAIPCALGAEFTRDVVALSDRLANGTSVTVKLQKAKLTPQYPYKHASMWGGDLSVMPKTVITSIDVLIGKGKTYVPLSAYSDLGDPGQVLLEKTQRGFKLHITGGDAASSYKAELQFGSEDIQRRRVCHGEFPTEVWEETMYSFISKDSPK